MSRGYFENSNLTESLGDDAIRSLNLSDPYLNSTDFMRAYEEGYEKWDKWTKIDRLTVTDDHRITNQELQQMNSTLNGKRLKFTSACLKLSG